MQIIKIVWISILSYRAEPFGIFLIHKFVVQLSYYGETIQIDYARILENLIWNKIVEF
jgi:hypothetical protein